MGESNPAQNIPWEKVFFQLETPGAAFPECPGGDKSGAHQANESFPPVRTGSSGADLRLPAGLAAGNAADILKSFASPTDQAFDNG